MGIDKVVNHWGYYVDSSKPTTGVFQNSKAYWLWEEIDNGSNFAWWQHLEYCEGNEDGDHDFCFEIDGSQTELIGFEQTTNKEESWYWLPKQEIGFMPDPAAEYSAIVGESYTQVVRSKWFIFCNLSSPCYPGQGDADSKGSFLAYSLPPDVIGEGEPDKSRIFSEHYARMIGLGV
jgi:hypothetical protein